MDFSKLYNELMNNHYCTSRELQYSIKYNYFLPINDLKQFNDFKANTLTNDINKDYYKLGLRSFNLESLYFSNCSELKLSLSNLLDLYHNDLDSDKEPIAIRNMPEILKSRIYSEVEGSLNIENIPSTRKRFNELVIKKVKPITTNDIIIKNMADAIEYVLSKPIFNKDNLFKLYSILSKDCLDDNHKLKDNEYYRYDDVFVGDDKGCPAKDIECSMNSLFEFVNNSINDKNNFIIAYIPHIVHFYIIYIHPYFDFNGRCARMVSFWIYLLTNNNIYPPFISDAINQTKNRYYMAIKESRNSHNDITYFLMYIMDISISYYLTYLNIDNIESMLLKKGINITDLDKEYIKKIFICSNGIFTYNNFIKWNNIEISKQGAFKILNRLTSYGILKDISTNNKKLFEVNKDILTYKMNSKSFNV